MTQIFFYPLGNADCCLIRLDKGGLIVFDYADKFRQDEDDDRRMPLLTNFKTDIGWPDVTAIDVLAITHGDDDHVRKICDAFWLKHAQKYQGDDRITIRELWVPAALIVEEACEDHTRIIQAEARHRFLNKDGIRVFARPEHLSDWLAERGKALNDYRDIITNAGEMVPAWSLENDGVEFFVHSPFAERTADGLLDRNRNCIVMQATLRVDGADTRFLITADSEWDNWQRMVRITQYHGNDARLAWDVFKIPHHCSYLSMAPSGEKGTIKTTPTPEFEWLLGQGTFKSVMVASCWPISEADSDDNQPPHIQAYRRYKETADELDADIVVTMENPTKTKPQRTIINVGGDGPALSKTALSPGISITTTKSPRMG